MKATQGENVPESGTHLPGPAPALLEDGGPLLSRSIKEPHRGRRCS